MNIIDAPNSLSYLDPKDTKIFLGGSIEMGKAVNWQQEFIKKYKKQKNLVLLNPRRPDWDSSWVQDPTPGTQFHEQVTWELKAQELADIIVYNFVADTASPITLLELGLFARPSSGKMVLVCCPKEYFRYGNVSIVCDEFQVPFVENMEDLYKLVDKLMEHKD